MRQEDLSALGQDILEGLQNAIAHAEGKTDGVQTHSVRIPDVAAIRQKLNVSQEVFAERFRIPLGTLRHWEQKRRQPDVAACLLLHIIDKEPKTVGRLLADLD